MVFKPNLRMCFQSDAVVILKSMITIICNSYNCGMLYNIKFEPELESSNISTHSLKEGSMFGGSSVGSKFKTKHFLLRINYSHFFISNL